jgi:hypothetical protein
VRNRRRNNTLFIEIRNSFLYSNLAIPSPERSVFRFSDFETGAFELTAARLQQCKTAGACLTVAEFQVFPRLLFAPAVLFDSNFVSETLTIHESNSSSVRMA